MNKMLLKQVSLKFAFIILLIFSGVTVNAGHIESGDFSFHRSYLIKGQNQEEILQRLVLKMSELFGEEGAVMQSHKIISEGKIVVSKKNLVGSSNKNCFFTYTINVKGDSLVCSFAKVFFNWYTPPMHKGDKGGQHLKNLEDVLPLDKKVPLEKKTYQEYLYQIEHHFEKIFNLTKQVIENQ